YFIVPDNADLTSDPQSTFSAWVYMDSGAFIDDYKIMSYGGLGGATQFNWGFTEDTVDSNLHMRVLIMDTGYAQQKAFSNSVLPFDSWHHVAIVRDYNSITFYLDGVADGTTVTNNGNPINPANDFWIGDESGTATSEGWNGKIDEFAYWDRNLSAQEIASYYSLDYNNYYWDLNVNDSTLTQTTGVKGFTLSEITAPEITITAPSNGSSSANHFMFIDANVSSTTNNDLNVTIFGDSNSSNLNNSLLYFGKTSNGILNSDYNWRSPVVSPDANTLLLFHFDNRLDFDENSSRVHDFSGRNFDASCVVGVSCPSVEDTNGYFGGTFNYDYGATGVCTDDCYFTIPDTDDLTIDPQSTFSAWVYMDSGAFIDDYKIMSYGGLGDAIFFNWGFTEDTIDSNLHMRVRYTTGTAQSLFSNSILPFDSWHHVAIVRNGTALTFYLDGVADGTQTMNTALAINPTREMWIGDESGTATTEGWNGKIDEFAYWDRNLSAQEIANYYSLGYDTYYWDLNVSDIDNNVSSGVKSFILTDGTVTSSPVVSVVSPVSGTFNKNSVSVVDVNISLVDIDTNAESFLVDLSYSSSQTEGTGSVILSDANLVNNFVCDSNDLSSARICTYHWDIDSVPNGTYYILANVSDGVNSDFASGATSFTITNVALPITFVQDKNLAEAYVGKGLASDKLLNLTLSSTATAGNLLVTFVALDKNALMYVPAGFTLISNSISNGVDADSPSEGVSCGAAYKIADGTEQTITWNFDKNNVAAGWVGEYSGISTINPLDVNTHRNSGVTIVTDMNYSVLATDVTTQSDELALSMFSLDSGNKIIAPTSLSDGFSKRHEIFGASLSGTPPLVIAEKVLSSTGSQNLTYTWTNAGDQACAAIATFRKASSLPSVSVVSPVSGSYDKVSVSVVDVNVSVSDLDSNAESILVDLNYSSSQTEGTGTVILSDANLSEVFVCDSNDLSSARTCMYHWDISSVPAGTYYILANVKSADGNAFDAGDTNFIITSVTNAQPTIDVNEPNGVSDACSTSYDVKWTVNDSDSLDSLKTSCYADSDGEGYTQTYACFTAVDSNKGELNSKLCDSSTWSAGNYYIWCEVNDQQGQINSTARAYSSGFLTQTIIGINLNDAGLNLGLTNVGDSINSESDSNALLIENVGNVDVNISIESTQLFIREPNSSESFTYKVSDFEVSSTGAGTRYSYGAVPINVVETAVSSLQYEDTSDEVRIDISMLVPTDEPSGEKGVTLTLIASQS
ncbi:MAG: LamG domain-containing protein, partial [Sphaerochaetaceae bacterium]|nr:LamG domain-containing protein [Sphaerochaetaceae bacterium]